MSIVGSLPALPVVALLTKLTYGVCGETVMVAASPACAPGEIVTSTTLSLRIIGETIVPVPPSGPGLAKSDASTDDAAVDRFDAARLYLRGELTQHDQRIARHRLGMRRAVVGVIFVFERQRAVGLDALRDVRIAARDQNQIAVQRAGRIDRPGAIDRRRPAEISGRAAQGSCLR